MDSPVNTRQTDPHVNPALSTQEMELVARADERLAHAYEQIARADEELARFNEQISRLEKKPANRLRQPSRGRPALRGLIGLLLTAGICTAAFAWQSYGETVRPMISRWAPQLAALRRCRRKHRSLPTSRARLPFRWLRRTQPFRNCHLRPRPHRKMRQPPRSLPSRHNCSRRWRAISQACSRRSGSSRPARKNWPAKMPGPPNSSRRTRNKWRARSPAPPSRTCGPGHQWRHQWRHQLIRHCRLPSLRVSPCRRFRRRKPERKRGRQCSCSPDNSSFHRRRRPPKAASSLSLVARIFQRSEYSGRNCHSLSWRACSNFGKCANLSRHSHLAVTGRCATLPENSGRNQCQ